MKAFRFELNIPSMPVPKTILYCAMSEEEAVALVKEEFKYNIGMEIKSVTEVKFPRVEWWVE